MCHELGRQLGSRLKWERLCNLLAARPFDEAQLHQRRLEVLAGEGGGAAPLVQQFTAALVAAIEQYGKRKVGRRKGAGKAGQPALP